MERAKVVRVLAVDDIESNLVALEALLRDSSVEMIRARSGQDALRALLDEEFALILLDVQMPEMDGFETAAAIRQRKKSSRIPIIFLTAHGSSIEKVARAYAVGGSDFMSKPLDPDALRAKVKAVADLWRQMDETTRDAAKEGERRLVDERQRWETETLRARIAEQEKTTAAEQAARLQAESANRMKDEFLATLSHELRTPLSAILGWATTLKAKGVADPSIARGLDAIERNAKTQAKLIEDLLDSSRIAAGKVSLEIRPVSVADILTAAVEGIRPTARQKVVTLELAIAEGLPVVAADPNRLQQVLANVLSNAVKFTPERGRVAVTADVAESRIHIEVKDTGVGITSDFLPHVFDRFRQADGSTTRRYGGLGIGLAVARQLIDLHGGSISAASAGRDQGTTFTITLPVRAVLPDPRVRPSPSLTEVLAATVELNHVRALIVDDEPDSRELVGEVLATAGATVRAVGSAETAFETFLAWRPDVIVSDIGMPGQDGYALMRRIRALPEDQAAPTPAVALTAYAGAHDVARAQESGFQAHLAKPIDPRKLVSTVAQLVAAALKERDRS